MTQTSKSQKTEVAEKVVTTKQDSVDDVLKFKKRMLEWPNPVEYVNNMYGCHPGDDDDGEYFKVVFKK